MPSEYSNKFFWHRLYWGGKKVRLKGFALPLLPHLPSVYFSCGAANHMLPSAAQCHRFSQVEEKMNYKTEQDCRFARVYPCPAINDMSLSLLCIVE